MKIKTREDNKIISKYYKKGKLYFTYIKYDKKTQDNHMLSIFHKIKEINNITGITKTYYQNN